ncbi:hypothetical protein J1N35_007347 [Gossypium stocksii]|uniref:Uncharacterized protein n=1 Tax=Gossypium stocksii TaxID=47602 RepID=A0A9D4AF69_9ROSI|nr:hypothetical protein J1N35_007347 [Gossypium stocksii]
MSRILDVVEWVLVRNVFQHCLRNPSPNGYGLTFSANQEVDQFMPYTLQAWPYNLDSEFGHVLLGCIREPPLYFYHICNLRLRNLTIISSSFTNSPVTNAGSSPSSQSQDMDISSLFKGTKG